MRLELPIARDLGSHLADGFAAADYRRGRIDPYVDICAEIVIDFRGVRTANSSFVNGLVAGLIEQHGPEILRRVIFRGCNPVLHVLVEAAIELGLSKTQGQTRAA
jgi:hypothetical protein